MLKLAIAFTICLLVAGNLSINNQMRELDGISVASQIPTQDSTISLKIVLNQRRLFVYQDGKQIASYPVAIGKKGWETPLGTWKVDEMIIDPAWTNFKTRKVVKPGKNNPLGSRWIGFYQVPNSEDVIGFHEDKFNSIGKAVTHGCVRMREYDIKKLYPLIRIGAVVTVVT